MKTLSAKTFSLAVCLLCVHGALAQQTSVQPQKPARPGWFTAADNSFKVYMPNICHPDLLPPSSDVPNTTNQHNWMSVDTVRHIIAMISTQTFGPAFHPSSMYKTLTSIDGMERNDNYQVSPATITNENGLYQRDVHWLFSASKYYTYMREMVSGHRYYMIALTVPTNVDHAEEWKKFVASFLLLPAGRDASPIKLAPGGKP